jgi:hypothetical protein
MFYLVCKQDMRSMRVPTMNRLEMLGWIAIQTCSTIMMCFTDAILDLETQFSCGWLFVGSFGITSFVFAFFICKNLMESLWLLVEKYF